MQELFNININRYAMEKIQMEPGVYKDIPFEDYVKIDAFNSSMLQKFMEESPLHFKYKLDNDLLYPDTDVLRIGRIVHEKILEEDEFKKKYVCEPRNWKEYERYLTDKAKKDFEEKPHYISMSNTNAYKELHKIFNGMTKQQLGHDNFEVLRGKEWDMLNSIYNNFHKNNRLSSVLKDSETELTVVWIDNITGIKLKMRIDINPQIEGYFADIKTTRSANPKWFEKDFEKNGYDFQFAMYADGYESIFEPLKYIVFIAIEKEEPYYIHPFYLSRDSNWFRIGRYKYRDAIEKLNYCIKSGEWDGYYDEKNDSYEMYQMGEPPHYIMNRYIDEIE